MFKFISRKRIRMNFAVGDHVQWFEGDGSARQQVTGIITGLQVTSSDNKIVVKQPHEMFPLQGDNNTNNTSNKPSTPNGRKRKMRKTRKNRR